MLNGGADEDSNFVYADSEATIRKPVSADPSQPHVFIMGIYNCNMSTFLSS